MAMFIGICMHNVSSRVLFERGCLCELKVRVQEKMPYLSIVLQSILGVYYKVFCKMRDGKTINMSVNTLHKQIHYVVTI